MIRQIAGTMQRFTPSLNLDFAKGVMPAGLTFTRGSIGTRTNAAGNIETIAANLPRFDYDPVTHVCKGLLIEESRTNLLTYSNVFGNAAWTKLLCFVATSATVAPDGTTASKLIANNGSLFTSATQIQQSVTLSNQNYTISIYAKAGEFNQLQIIASASGATGRAVFDLSTGTIPYLVSGTATITAVGNGWYRCSVSSTSVFTGTLTAQFRVQDGTATTGDGASGIYLYGAQIEAGSFATSYIPTTSSAVLRNSDVCLFVVQSLNPNQGTFLVDVQLNKPLPNDVSVFRATDISQDWIAGTSGSYQRLNIMTGASVLTGTFSGAVNPAGSRFRSAYHYVSTPTSSYTNAYTAGVKVLSWNGSINLLHSKSFQLGGNATDFRNVCFGSLLYYPFALPENYLKYLTQ